MFALAGCNAIKYNAEMNSFAKELVSAEFLNENRVKAFYLNENYVEGESLPSEKYIFDDKSPQSRTFLIKEKEEFNSMFFGYSTKLTLISKWSAASSPTLISPQLSQEMLRPRSLL